MADAVSDLLQQYYGTPDTLGGNVQPRAPRAEPYDMYGEDVRPQQLGQHNLIPRAASAIAQPMADAVLAGIRGQASPQQVAWDVLSHGPVGPAGFLRMPAPSSIRAFHSTSTEVGPEFRFRRYSEEELGPHFGTAEQANSRLADLYDQSGTSVIPVNLRLRNPLEIRDPGQFDAYGLPEALASTGQFTHQELARLSRLPGGAMEELWQEVSSLLRSRGYDSIRYRNSVEHPDMTALTQQFRSANTDRDRRALNQRRNKLSDHLERHGDYSYMPMAPNTVYSATTGRPMYGVAAPAALSTADILSQYGSDPSQP